VRRLEVAARAQGDIERFGSWWLDNRDKAPELFDQELAIAYWAIQTQPEYGQHYAIVRGKQVWRYLMPKTKRHVYYRLDGADVVRLMAVCGAERGRGPRL
jgi:plasmid stabilization system protein ParE